MTGIKEYLSKYINENIRENVLNLYESVKDDLAYYPASVKYHHNSVNGLQKHTTEVIEIALKVFKTFEDVCRKRLITESDVVLMAFLHDLEKIGKYKANHDYDSDNFKANVYPFKYNYDRIDVNDTARVVALCAKFNIHLTEKQLNALTFTHGNWSVDKGKMLGLATIIHMADMLSITFYDK